MILHNLNWFILLQRVLDFKKIIKRQLKKKQCLLVEKSKCYGQWVKVLIFLYIFIYSPEPGLGFYSVYERKYISYDWSQDGAINLSYWSFFGPGATKIPPPGEPRYINIQILLDFLYTRSNQF